MMKYKLMNYPTETEHEAIGFLFLSSYISHVSMHYEKSRRLSVLWTIWNFSMISVEKVPGSFDFCHHRGVDLVS